MARLIIWSQRAVEDLEAIAAFIAHDSEAYAKSVTRTILKKVRLLAEYPLIGRIVPEFEDEAIREIFAYSYRIIYKVSDNEIVPAAIVHGKRIIDLSFKP